MGEYTHESSAGLKSSVESRLDDFQRYLVDHAHSALAKPSFSERNVEMAATVADEASVLAADSTRLHAKREQTIGSIPLRDVFFRAALEAGKAYSVYFDEQTGQFKETEENVTEFDKDQVPMNKAGYFAKKHLPDALQAAGIQDVDVEALLIKAMDFRVAMQLTAYQLGRDFSANLSHEKIMSSLGAIVNSMPQDKETRYRELVDNLSISDVDTFHPLSENELQALDMAVRLANVTWKVGQAHRAVREDNDSRVTPDRGVFDPYDLVISKNYSAFAPAEGSDSALLGTTLVEVWKDIRQLEQAFLFGPVGKGMYPKYAQQKIKEQFGNPANPKGREDRAALWKNYEGLRAVIAISNGDVVQSTREYLKGLNVFARNQLENTPKGGLGIHLKEITEFSRNFLLDVQGNSRFPNLISTHNAQLFADVAAPMHDVLKFLGTTDAQVMPDHETITAAFVRENFAGREVTLRGKPYTLTSEDAEFIAGVIADHENIEKPNEASRSSYIHGGKLERAKALFFVADVLTGAVVPEGDGNTFTFDLKQLDTRFTDLYFRHIDLVKGKIFRPQWGAHTIGDLVETFNTLQTNGLRMNNPEGRSTKDILVSAALEAIIRARAANDTKFTQEQLTAISAAEQQLRSLII